MTTFTDSQDNTWNLSLTIGSAKRLKGVTGLDILAPMRQSDTGTPALTEIALDPTKQAEAIACLLDKQFEAKGISGDDVFELFDGPTLAASQEAFMAELENFFQSLGHTARAALVKTNMKMVREAVKQATARIGALDIEAAVSGAASMLSPEAFVSAPTG